jgi:hypothetical protein
MSHRAPELEGQLWVDHASSFRRAQMAAFGASRPLPRVTATVRFLITDRAVSRCSGNWSSCPFAVIARAQLERLGRVESGRLDVYEQTGT